MKILIIGGTGTIGQSVADDLGTEHEVISVGRTPNKDGLSVDILYKKSIQNMYKKIGKVDAVVSTVGGVTFKQIHDITEKDMHDSLNNKFMGQVNLVLIGQKYLNSGGSFTLTSGILSHRFILNGVCATTINCAINGFVQSSAVEFIKNNFRINAISPTVLEDSYDKYYPFFSGFFPVSNKKVAYAYRMSVTGIETGKIFDVE